MLHCSTVAPRDSSAHLPGSTALVPLGDECTQIMSRVRQPEPQGWEHSDHSVGCHMSRSVTLGDALGVGVTVAVLERERVPDRVRPPTTLRDVVAVGL